MPAGAGSQACGPNPSGPRRAGSSSPAESQAETPGRATARGYKPSASPSQACGDQACPPRWAPRSGLAGPQRSPGLLSALSPPCLGGTAATGPMARLGRRREARLPFSRFLDEVTVQVLDPRVLEAFRAAPRGHSQEPTSAEERGSGLAQECPRGTTTLGEKDPALNAPCSLEAAAEAAGRGELAPALETRGPCVESLERGSRATCSWRHLDQVSCSLS